MEEEKLEELKSRLKQTFSDYYEEAGGWEFRYHHLLRTRTYALKLMESIDLDQKPDPVVVEVAALFHDIGRTEDIEDGYLNPMDTHEGHAETGGEIVEEYVRDIVSNDRLERIEKVIRNHHSEPETVEGKIVQDADDLGLTGTMNLWRMVHYASDNQRVLDETFDYFKNTASGDLKDRINSMHLEKSKEVARKRLENYRDTIETMEKEALGEDIE